MAAPFEVLVTGDAARLVDYRGMLADYGPVAALIVVAATMALLAAFTRSLLLPLKAVLTSVLSIGAALGVVTLVFQDRGDLGMIDLTVPVLVAAIAFGLSVDYEVFLLARIREHLLTGADSRRSVAVGLQQTGRIVTSAALLLVVVFAGFLVGGFAPIREIGLGLVVAIVLDADRGPHASRPGDDDPPGPRRLVAGPCPTRRRARTRQGPAALHDPVDLVYPWVLKVYRIMRNGGVGPSGAPVPDGPRRGPVFRPLRAQTRSRPGRWRPARASGLRALSQSCTSISRNCQMLLTKTAHAAGGSARRRAPVHYGVRPTGS